MLILSLPPHAGHLFQPLDLALFGVIKTILKNPEHRDEVNQQAEFELPTTFANIRSAFGFPGIVSTMEEDSCTHIYVGKTQ